MSGRRGAGEGAVYFVESKGLWAAAVDLGMVDGRRARKVVKAKTKAQVLRKLRALQGRLDAGLPASDDAITTGEWLEWWAANVLPGTVTPKTEASYRWLASTYITPHVGRVKLSRLGPEHVQSMMRALEAKGLSPRSIAYSRAVLRRALGQAVKWGKVTRNAAALVDAPRKAAPRLDDALSAGEAEAVLEAAHGDRLEALAVLVLAVGLRQGEALRLRWPDVHLSAGTLRVRQSKTEAGKRTIALPGFVVAALRAHRARQLEERMAAPYWGDERLVFASTIGTPLEPRNVLRWWHELTIRAGVGRRRFHASRHTAATLMLNAGVPLEVVSSTLGHAGLAITADVYAKVGAKLQRQAAEAMEGVFGGR